MVNVDTHRYPQVKFHSLTTFCADYRVWVVPGSQWGNISFFSATDVFLLHSLELKTRPFYTPFDQGYQRETQWAILSNIEGNKYGSNRTRRLVLCDIFYVFSFVLTLCAPSFIFWDSLKHNPLHFIFFPNKSTQPTDVNCVTPYNMDKKCLQYF